VKAVLAYDKNAAVLPPVGDFDTQEAGQSCFTRQVAFSESEVSLTIEGVHARAEAVTSVLEAILHFEAEG
jgi:hypothetical protein